MARSLLPWILVGCSGTPKPVPADIPTAPVPSAKSTESSSPRPPEPIVDARPDPVTKNARELELAPKLAGYLDAFTNTEPAFTPDGKRVVFVSSRDGLPQLYIAGKPDEPATRIAATKHRVASPIPTAEGKSVIFRMDADADENWSIFRIDLDGTGLVELTPSARKLDRGRPIIPAGRPSTMFFHVRERTSAKTTIVSASTTAAGEQKVIFTDDKPAFLADVSPDGARAIVIKYPSRSENHAVLLEVESGKTTPVFPAPGAKVSIASAGFSADGKRVLLTTDNGDEQALVLAFDLAGRQVGKLALAPATATIAGAVTARTGGLMAITASVGSRSEMHLIDTRTLTKRATVAMPLGAGAAFGFSADGKRLAASWSTATSPTELYAIDTRTGARIALKLVRRDGASSLRVERLDADAHAVHALLEQGRRPRFVEGSGVALDGDLHLVDVAREGAEDARDDPAELARVPQGGRATAKKNRGETMSGG